MKELFEKYIKRECSKEEIQQIVAYFRNSEELDEFPTIEAVSELLRSYPDMEDVSAENIYANIVKKPLLSKIFSRNKKIAMVAAIFIGILTTQYIFDYGLFKTSENKIVSESEVITLELEDGKVVVISENDEKQLFNTSGHVVGKQQGNQLHYNPITNSEKLVYNTLTVPYGKRFEIFLSDGSQVYLNAGTSLRYPVKFIKGKNRQVFLDGEAYFRVSEDKTHPFIVNTNEVNVKVLGTEFNMSTYKEDAEIKTVLVEGSVIMYAKNTPEDQTTLAPGNIGAWDKSKKRINTSQVDTRLYTGWIDGELIFRNSSFSNMIKKLERSYNISIQNNNTELDLKKFNASFHVDIESVEEVMNSIGTISPIEFEIKNNEVIIN
ncbi:FecR domain-containing protein [Seonamhaeicola sp.]|uniref:FecR family protein n=1 Tax=Seonamhaeicola sp. TaxID=1912245 RepID=UPI002621FBE6|nr:FecR domain-containing protein [Seonamhaeicola sp.]